MSFLRCLSVLSDASCCGQVLLSTNNANSAVTCTYLGQTPADGTGLLWSEVKGGILLVLVELAEVLPLLLVHDGEDTSNGLADRVAGKSSPSLGCTRSKYSCDVHPGQLCSIATSDLLYPQGQKLMLELDQLLRQVVLRPRPHHSATTLSMPPIGPSTHQIRTWTGARTP